MPIVFSAGTMCCPMVTVDVREGLKASPLKRTTASPSPRSTDSLFSSWTRVTKRARPPTGSLSRGSTLYTSLKWRIVIRFVARPSCFWPGASSRIDCDLAGAPTRTVQGSVRPPPWRTWRTAESRRHAVSQSSLQEKTRPFLDSCPTHQPSTSMFSIHAVMVASGTPLASRSRPSGSSVSPTPVHSIRSRSPSSGPPDACTQLFMVLGSSSSPSDFQCSYSWARIEPFAALARSVSPRI
mmetsp:Transcript_97377/g.275921  ORF Transcript_97377/g.275921 Transcript_97377/m.275921 type:complete len:239 (+) Transcript_97377:31-747(+)